MGAAVRYHFLSTLGPDFCQTMLQPKAPIWLSASAAFQVDAAAVKILIFLRYHSARSHQQRFERIDEIATLNCMQAIGHEKNLEIRINLLPPQTLGQKDWRFKIVKKTMFQSIFPVSRN